MCKVGLFWSLTVSMFIGLATAYGLSLVDWVATALEVDMNHHHRLKNADEICQRLDRPFVGLAKFLMMAGSIAVMLGSSVSNIIMVAKNMDVYLGIDPLMGKLLVFVITCIFLAIIVEPETISKFLNVSVVVMLFLSSSLHNPRPYVHVQEYCHLQTKG